MAEITARALSKDVRAAIRAASEGPVVITDRGEPTHVLLSIKDYRRLLADTRSIVDWLSVDDGLDLEPDIVKVELHGPNL